jgi:uncharacterized protein (DUF2235 family)
MGTELASFLAGDYFNKAMVKVQEVGGRIPLSIGRYIVPKKLVICCDSTNGSFQRDLTNVARMSCIAAREPGAQHVYYDCRDGVGSKNRNSSRN